MINKSTAKTILSVLVVALLFSCKKDKTEIEQCTGGTGGNLTLKVFLQHGDHAVVNLKNYRDTVYVKYHSKEYPGSSPSVYDETLIGDWPGDSVNIPNLKCGDYYLFAVGFESVHGYRVSGGIPFSTSQKDGEIRLTIPVSE